MARYPQLYSRIGFVHEFRPIGTEELRRLLDRAMDATWCETARADFFRRNCSAAAIIRITGGNFRLLNRLLAQIERILSINGLEEVSKDAVEVARKSLVIGGI